MRRLGILLLAVLAVAPLPARAGPSHLVASGGGPDPADCRGPVVARVSIEFVQLRNGCVVRWWVGPRLQTTLIADARTGFASTARRADFSLELDGARVAGDLPITAVRAEVIGGVGDGLRVIWTLLLPEILEVTRVVEMYRGIAGMVTRTTVRALTPLALSGYVPERVDAGGGALATVHAMRAGADWREASWAPQVAVGDPHTGTWRVEQTADGPGAAIEAPGEWLSAALPGGERIALVLERRDYASSRMNYDGAVASARVDLSRDVVYFGPFEQNIHAENPVPGPARHRALVPGRPLALEPVTLVLGTDADDEPWQFHRILTEHRLTPYRREVVFNTNNIEDANRSTGAKDDTDFERFLPLAGAARQMGIDTFIFDDGWQARSGDWCPDSLACPEPRWDGSADSMFRPRFPDDSFEAVREVLAGDPGTPDDDIALGLWLTPMAFHPSANAFLSNPHWSCIPVGTATGLASFADDGGSFEAGIGLWNPLAWGIHPDTLVPVRAIDYVEDRIRRAIEVYGASYFKFDYLVWVDCGGAEPVTMYEYRDAFVAMMDRLQAAHPEVTFQVDETNDYRLFPYESVARGPSWFQNGSPPVEELLHNLWNLAPYVPGFSLGQHLISNGTDRGARGIDFLMAAALTQHQTIWMRIDADLTDAQRDRAKLWTDFYTENAAGLGTFMYPLLGDPAAGGWTAVQPWDRDARSGSVLVYRLGPAGPAPAVALRGLGGVPDATEFTLTRVDPGAGTTVDLGLKTAAELRAGIAIDPGPPGYAIVRVEPV